MRALEQQEQEAANPTVEPEDRWLYQPLHATGVTAAAAAAAAAVRARLLQEKAAAAVQELVDDEHEMQHAAAAAEQAAKEADQAHTAIAEARERARIDALVAAADSLFATPAADRVLAAAAAADAAAAHIIDQLLSVVARAAAQPAAAQPAAAHTPASDVLESGSIASSPRLLPNTHAVIVPNLIR
jgi:pilus assembly protein FimV